MIITPIIINATVHTINIISIAFMRSPIELTRSW
nr:MAG TPA: hypothetical protein [Caudoviricetes sp.]